jgi:hypothetical protein
MMCASWDRSSGMRRKVPLNIGAQGHRTVVGHIGIDGDQTCIGGAPTRRGTSGPHDTELVRTGGHLQVAVISAHTNPASSRAMAVTTTFLLTLRSTRCR